MTIISKLFEIAKEERIDLGLQRMRALNALLGRPATAFPAIHVGGTNGKGSTTLKIARALQQSGMKVGLYTSPHIASFRERITLNGEKIPLKVAEEHLATIFSLGLEPTFFEITTLLAFLYFTRRKVDVAVIEVGLGGRLDATNLVRPVLSVITSIDYDHTHLLGETLEEIAFEKGGIIKEGIPVVLGPKANHPVLRKIAQLKKSPCHLVTNSVKNFEEENQNIAKMALEVLQKPINAGIEAIPPCRFETFSFQNHQVILDVAHNPEAFTALLARLPAAPFACLLAFSQDKEVEKCLDILLTRRPFLILTQATHHRALAPHLVGALLTQKGYTDFCIEADIASAFALALQNAPRILVTGTFYIMKEVRRALGISEEWDC